MRGAYVFRSELVGCFPLRFGSVTLLTGPGFGWGLCFGATKTFHQNRFLSVWIPVTPLQQAYDNLEGVTVLHEYATGARDMRAVAEYRKHAEECRRLAQQMVAPEDRRALEELADRWEMLEKLRDRDLVPED